MEHSNQTRSPVLHQTPHRSFSPNAARPSRSNPTQPLSQPFQNTQQYDHNQEEDDDEEEEGDPASNYDVYKDFNNAGVRYVNIVESPEEPLNTTYPTSEDNKLEIPKEKFILANDSKQQTSSNSKLLSSNRHSKRNSKQTKSLRKRWGWRLGAVIAFIVLACLGIAIYFVIPRQPAISFDKPISFKGNSTSAIFNPSKPTGFSFDARLSMALDGRSSYIPARIRSFRVFINDLGSTSESILVGKGGLDKAFTVGTSALTSLDMDVQFSYTAGAQTDALWQAWHQACVNVEASKVNGTVTRPALQLSLVISFDMLGIPGARGDSTQLNGVSCPIELPV
ncbi:uncharacterized protein MELLADRAFT_78837 [Melampsora larici-populina 98AG31]|uniref:Uncharacterized protein n=1 Tax=Melampsora larici-populina (strain 98AG31 / pathotype 3-4-7) TaxID=747676 RepID=F4RZE6_MELLP|nr:uncharacterized protein MELLADRAFT_78837 [Melampsora larici-populina 98AG31]EGG02268.1 hypothetical protein MELLADRAFT_78837 [Melampsora larici-populina 98AG31]